MGAPYISFQSIRVGETGAHSGISIIDTNGKNLRHLTNHRSFNCCATWAPDGRSFAFISNRDGNYEIYIKTFNEAEERRLTNQQVEHADPAWSPDGNWISFVSKRTGEPHIYKIDINGKNLQKLTNQGQSNDNPTWSPDGQSITFYSIGIDGPGIYMIDTDGKHLRQIIDGRDVVVSLWNATWSPDGKQIACGVANRDWTGIYIMDTDGQNDRRVSPLGTWSYNPAWSPDGKWIAYESRFEDRLKNQIKTITKHVFIVSVEGGEPRQITQHPGLHSSPEWVPESYFSVSPTVDTQTTLWGRLKQTERMTQ